MAAGFSAMASISLFLDTRSNRGNQPYPLKWYFFHNSRVALLPTGLRITKSQWDTKRQRLTQRHPNFRAINQILEARISQINLVIAEWKIRSVLANIDVMQLRDNVAHLLPPLAVYDPGLTPNGIIQSPIQPIFPYAPPTVFFEKKKTNFISWFDRYAATKSARTAEVYEHTKRRLIAYTAETGSGLESLTFEDITPMWLQGFDVFMAQTAPSANSRAIHMRNIRTVFNSAIAEELITCYPFKRFKIKTTKTRKRSLSVDDIRLLATYPCDSYTAYYRDIFMLIFYLVGINLVDLCQLTNITKDGRIEYKRAKTGRLYSIKVEPEAKVLIDKFHGKSWLINILDRYKNHRDFGKHINAALKKIGETKRSGLGGKKTVNPLFPELSTYWARHSWATIAASLDIPKETIAAALGHGGNTVTDIYIDFDVRKIDEANRRVIDWVLYGKK